MAEGQGAPETTAQDGEAAPTVESAVLAEDLAVAYDEEPVVECRRLDLPAGAVTAVVGPNGSGKSTLLRALSGELEPADGVVRLDGRALSSYGSKELARELGHLSQEHDAPAGITVERLVHHGRYPHRGALSTAGPADHRAVDRALELAGVEHLRDRTVGALSGGQKQLVWIAVVLAQETDVLLLDEPTTFLDVHHQLRVLDTVERLNERTGVTVGVVLHDVAQAARFADYVVALSGGAVYDWGPPGEVVTEELLADVFAVDAAVSHEPDVRVQPRRPLERS
jgi:ABC-type cobalamin/Fe3+-siderophores transport system ATPase subunit